MHARKLPGELLPHTPPPKIALQRLQTFTPYVREAKEARRPKWSIKPRKLFDFLMMYWVEGTGGLRIGDWQSPAKEGDLFWIPPNTLHEQWCDSESSLLRYIHFDLFYDPSRSHWGSMIFGNTTDLSAWPETMHPPLDDPVIGKWCGKMEGYNPAFVSETLRCIIMEYSRTQTSNLTIEGLVLQLLGHLLGHLQENSPLKSHHAQTIKNAMQHIQLHCHEKLNIEVLARQLGLSPNHFRRLFREQYGHNPRTAYMNAKMLMACDSLIYTNLTVSEIAYQLGFANVHSFSRAFHKAIGLPPSAYRTGSTKPNK